MYYFLFLKKVKNYSFILTVFLFLGFLLYSCSGDPDQKDYTAFADPSIGTGGHGHTYPGAAMPFGMVQLSPDTREENWDGSSGYHYSDPTIMGFTHTHLSGTGAPEYCDVLLMPTIGAIQLQVGDEKNPQSGYRSAFSHNNEYASPGYYSVLLDDHNIKAELTATQRSGMHRYTFPESGEANIIVDLKHRDRVIDSYIEVVNDTIIRGMRRSGAWANDQYIYFYAKFSRPFTSYGIAVNDSLAGGSKKANGTNIKAYVRFTTEKSEQIQVKVGISAVDMEGAKNNLRNENPGWDFNEIKQNAAAIWNKQLSKIEITGVTERQKRIFYSAFYHTALAPNIFMDADGRYRGVDHKIHRAQGFSNYTVFSLWDTFRALMPLYNITDRQRSLDFVKTFLEMYRIGGRLPQWELAGNYTGVMIGFHALPVILDAYRKGIRDFDVDMAYNGMYEWVEMNRGDLDYFRNLGFIPADKEGGSVSKVMEYAYNNWCVSAMAQELGRENDFKKFHQRAAYYRHLYDSSTKFMRPKNANRSWVTPFNPAQGSEHYVEGNAFQYSLFAPQDIPGLIQLTGGDDAFVAWLDTLFTHKSKYDKDVKDAAGLIGQYAHGNEPSHHMAYLYNYAGAPWKTQSIVWRILEEQYDDKPDGLSGNEDCGQMSAWYVLSAMGFYPVCPGRTEYAIGSPLFEKTVIHLENGKTFTIKAIHVSAKNKYIQSATLNGANHSRSWLDHSDIMKGGVLVFEMGAEPQKTWGAREADRPQAEIFKQSVALPYAVSADRFFLSEAKVELYCDMEGAQIYYTTNGSDPDENSNLYTKPFYLIKTTDLKFAAYKDGLDSSLPATEKFLKINFTAFRDYTNEEQFLSGLEYKYYHEKVRLVRDLDDLEPVRTGLISHFNIDERDRDSYIGYNFSGYIKVPHDGIYTFYNKTNDGSILYLDDKEFINTDRGHPAYEKSRTVALRKGIYKIAQKYFQLAGGWYNRVSWEGPGIEKQEIPSTVLFHERKQNER